MRPIKRQRETGSQLVELAITLPMLMFLALMVSEGAGALRAHIVLNNAAREGAHFSSLNNCGIPANAACLAAIQGTVISYAANNGITLTAAEVTVDQSLVIASAPVGLSASQVTLAYQYPLPFLAPLINAFFGASPGVMTLGAQVEFRNFY